MGVHGDAGVYRRRDVVDTGPRRADIEIDLDVEHDSSPPFAYLWGALLTNRSGRPFPEPDGYRPFAAWTPPTEASDAELFSRLWTWLKAVSATASNHGLTVAIYSWGTTERTRLMAAAGALRGEVEVLVDNPVLWVDLHDHVRDVVIAAEGTSLKTIAHQAGFAWCDPNANGLGAVFWFEAAVRGDHEARQRLLTYNEDDVSATRAVRDWLSRNSLPAMPP